MWSSSQRAAGWLQPGARQVPSRAAMWSFKAFGRRPRAVVEEVIVDGVGDDAARRSAVGRELTREVEAGRGVADVARDADLEPELTVAARLSSTVTVGVTRGAGVGREGPRGVRLRPRRDLVGEEHVAQPSRLVEDALVDLPHPRDQVDDRLVGHLDQQRRLEPGAHLLAVRAARATSGESA